MRRELKVIWSDFQTFMGFALFVLFHALGILSVIVVILATIFLINEGSLARAKPEYFVAWALALIYFLRFWFLSAKHRVQMREWND